MDSVDWSVVEKFSTRGKIQKVIDQLTFDLVKIKKPSFEQELKAYFYSKDSQSGRLDRAYANIMTFRRRTISIKKRITRVGKKSRINSWGPSYTHKNRTPRSHYQVKTMVCVNTTPSTYSLES